MPSLFPEFLLPLLCSGIPAKHWHDKQLSYLFGLFLANTVSQTCVGPDHLDLTFGEFCTLRWDSWMFFPMLRWNYWFEVRDTFCCTTVSIPVLHILQCCCKPWSLGWGGFHSPVLCSARSSLCSADLWVTLTLVSILAFAFLFFIILV